MKKLILKNLFTAIAVFLFFISCKVEAQPYIPACGLLVTNIHTIENGNEPDNLLYFDINITWMNEGASQTYYYGDSTRYLLLFNNNAGTNLSIRVVSSEMPNFPPISVGPGYIFLDKVPQSHVAIPSYSHYPFMKKVATVEMRTDQYHWNMDSLHLAWAPIQISLVTYFDVQVIGGDEAPAQVAYMSVEGYGVLPVELSEFQSAINVNNVILHWNTTDEINNSFFNIERSTDKIYWINIGSVLGKGTTSGVTSYTFEDKDLLCGTYFYRLKQVDLNGSFKYFNLANEVIIRVPTNYELSQNYPNPFNPITWINFSLPREGKVSLKIYNMTGKEVMTLVNEVRSAGYYSESFNSSSLSSGVYFYCLSADNFNATKRMMLIK